MAWISLSVPSSSVDRLLHRENNHLRAIGRVDNLIALAFKEEPEAVAHLFLVIDYQHRAQRAAI